VVIMMHQSSEVTNGGRLARRFPLPGHLWGTQSTPTNLGVTSIGNVYKQARSVGLMAGQQSGLNEGAS